RRRDPRLDVGGAAGRRALRKLLLGLRAQPLPVGEQLLVEEGEQQVLRIDLRIPALDRERLRSRDRLLCLDGQPVEIHSYCPLVAGGFGGRYRTRSRRYCLCTWSIVSRISRSIRSIRRRIRASSSSRRRTRSTPARLSPISVVSCWISLRRATSSS